MQLTKCKWCGKAFQSYGNHMCPQCMENMENQYKPVRDFLYENPNASVEQVMEATGVEEKVILYYLRDGRLQMSGLTGLLKCQQCGLPINSGRLCEKCKAKLDARMVQPIQAKMAREQEARRRAQMDAEFAGRRMHTTRPDELK